MSENIEQKCIAKGVKLTDQRKIIAKVMSEANDHPDVDELYNRVSKTQFCNFLHWYKKGNMKKQDWIELAEVICDK